MQSSSIFLSEYAKILTAYDIDDEDLGVQIAFPNFSEDLTIKLLDETLSILKKLPIIYNLPSNIYIVGDLHGNIRDLIRILKKVNFLDSEVKVLFLGDYVDRGDFSIEVITLLFSPISQYPDRIFLLRGNHEFSSVNMNYGFKDQIVNVYGNDSLWEQFNILFSYLPIAAIVNKHMFCIHGGISPHLKSIHQIENLERPLVSFHDNNLLADLMWSDPSVNVSFYIQSERGYGCIFGQDAIIDFCRTQKIEKVIRAHQCVAPGIENALHGKVITVFSCSNYCDTCQNNGGYLFISENDLNPFELLPLHIMKRDKAHFIDFSKKGSLDLCDSNDSLPYQKNISLISSNFNTGIKNSNLKLTTHRRKSSFCQSFSRNMQIPLSSTHHMLSSDQFVLNRSSDVTKSSQNFNLSELNNGSNKLSKNNEIGHSQIYNMMKINRSSTISRCSIPPLKQSNQCTLPIIPENRQEMPIDLQNTHLLSLYPEKNS